jgi:Mg2+/Co2+ transporter CorB
LGNNKSSVSAKYIAGVAFVSFLLGAGFFILSQLLAQKLNNLVISAIFLILIITVGIIFDTVGTAAAAATEATFHSRAAKRVPGARESVYLVRNADKVANIANDVVGDIAGTVSGAIGISLVLQVIQYYPRMNDFLVTMVTTATIAALTVGGKAFGKKLALSRANDIIFLVGRITSNLERITGRQFVPRRRR